MQPAAQGGQQLPRLGRRERKAEAGRVFQALGGDGGEITIANAPWGPYFGMRVDRFGTQWMVCLPTPA